MDVHTRLKLVNDIHRSIRKMRLTDGSPSCVAENNVLANTFKLVSKIGSGSKNGEAFKICYPISCGNKDNQNCTCSKQPINLAVKRIPVTSKIMQHANNSYSKKALENSFWVEILCMKLCNYLVEGNITPNLPMYVNFFQCNSCVYENVELKKSDGGSCVIIVNELATEGDIKYWSQNPRTASEWINAYFQIFNALYALQKYFNITHHDLHWGNVLVHKVKPGGFWRYTIDKQTYDVPNLGYLFVLWDFGIAYIPGKMENTGYTHHYNSAAEKPRLLADYFKAIKFPVWRENDERLPIPAPDGVKQFYEFIRELHKGGASLKEIMKIFRDIYPKQNGVPQAGFSLDVPAMNLGLPKELQTFVNVESVPGRTRRPSVEEITVQDMLGKVVKNGFVAQTKKRRRAFTKELAKLSKMPSFNERVVLEAELEAINYPPPVVEDIEDPLGKISASEEFITEFGELVQPLRGKWPDFVDDILDKLFTEEGYINIKSGSEVNRLVTRQEWARVIQWLRQINADEKTVSILQEPVIDYFKTVEGIIEAYEEPLEPREPTESLEPDDEPEEESHVEYTAVAQPRMEPTNEVQQPKIPERPAPLPPMLLFVERIRDGLLQAGDNFINRTADDLTTMVIVTEAIRDLYNYLDRYDKTAKLNPDDVIRATRKKLSEFACVFQAFPEEFVGQIDPDNFELLESEDPSVGRVTKLLLVAFFISNGLLQPKGIDIVLNLLKSYNFGVLNQMCSKNR